MRINGPMDSLRAILKYRCVNLSLHQWLEQKVSTLNV